MPNKRDLTKRAVLAALVAGVVVAAGLVVALNLSVLAAYIVGLGLSTFLIYGYDKLRARRGGQRVPESALLALPLIGGALGGWAGVLILRHKTRHAVFWGGQVIGTIVIAAAPRGLGGKRLHRRAAGSMRSGHGVSRSRFARGKQHR